MRNWLNKNIRKNENLFFLIVFAAFFLISFRKVFLANGTLGHNWDWSFPALDFLFRKIDLLSRYAWWDFDLGIPLGLNLSQLGPNTLVKILAFLFSPKIVILTLIFLICLNAFFSFKKLLDFVNQKTFLNYLPSFLYAFSPFLFNDIIGGSWYMWVSFSAAPWFYLFLVKFARAGSFKYLFGFLLSSIFVIASLQQFVLIEIIVFSYLLFQIIVDHLNFKKIIFRYFLAHLVLIIINLYWLGPFFYSFIDFAKNVSQTSFAGSFVSVRNSTQNLLSIASLVGYLNRNLYYFALNKFLIWPMVLSVILVWVSILGFFKWGEKSEKIKALGYLIILLFLSFLIKGGNWPLGDLTMWIYNHFPLMKLFRSPQHLMFAAAFIIPILLSFSLNFFYQTFAKYKKLVLAVFVLCLFFWLSGWWANGDLGHEILKNQKKDYIDFYQLPPELTEIYRQNEQGGTDGRVIFLPSVNSPDYLANEYQNSAQGGQPEYMYLKNPTFTSESNQFANNIEISFCKETNFDYLKYLSLFSVKNIILRSDIYPQFTLSSKCWSNGYVKARLDSTVSLEKNISGEYAVAYKINDDYLLPHFYIPKNIVYSDGSIDSLADIVSFKDYSIRSGIYLYENGKWKMENGKLASRADEFFIGANLENAIDQQYFEKLELFKESVSFPYVSRNSKSFLYPLVLKKEQFEEWKVRNDPEKLIDKKLFYAGKRISEFEGLTDYTDEDAVTVITQRYQNKMKEVVEKIRELKNQNKPGTEELIDLLVIKLRAYRDKHKEKVKLIYLDRSKSARGSSDIGKDWNSVFTELDEEIMAIEKKFGLRNLEYNFEIPQEEEYAISMDAGAGQEIIKVGTKVDGEPVVAPSEQIKVNGWLNLGSDAPKEGKHKLSLSLPEPENLTGENWQVQEEPRIKEDEIEFSPLGFSSDAKNIVFQEINNWQPNSFYHLTFDYQTETGNLNTVILEDRVDYRGEEKTQEQAKILAGILRSRKDGQWEKFDRLLKADDKSLGAKIYFYALADPDQVAKINFKNLKITMIVQPKIVLRAKTGNVDNTPAAQNTPKITFIKINPTKYKVKVEGGSQPYTLIFSESFFKGWKAYIQNDKCQMTNDKCEDNYGETAASYFGGEIKEGTHQNIFLNNNTFETWGKKAIPEDRHLLVNGYANSWYITPQDSGNRENYEIIIELWPQRLLYTGLGISLAVLFGGLGFLGYNFARRKLMVGNEKN